MVEALQHVTIKLQLEKGEEDDKVIYLNTKEPELASPQRRQIGFRKESEAESSCDLYSTPNTEDAHTKHEYSTKELREAKQRLKMYKKRLGSHQQKAMAQEREKGTICRRTAEAIENNQTWVEHYTAVITQITESLGS